MEKEVDIVALGELLIDFTEAGKSKDNRKLFEQNPGGAPANLLTVASHMGYRTEFTGKVGRDMHGALISYDPNYRESLWESRKLAVERMCSVIKNADVMKVSDEESLLLTGMDTYEQAADKLLQMGPSLVAVTLGGDGVLIATKEKKEKVPGYRVQAVDTTGAGDSFWGGFLSHFLQINKNMDEMTWDEIRSCAVYGNITAALCVQKRGGIPAIPRKEEVEEFYLTH